MRERTPFNQKPQMFDKLHGMPGANQILRNKFLEYVLNTAKNKTYFSNTTYSIIYKLIKTDKIGLFFNPSVKIREFFVSDEPVHISGGYDFNKRRIEIYVNWRYGYDAIFQVLKSYMPLLCNKIFATILSESLLIYDYKHNGELSKHDKIKQWYYEYFRGVFGTALKQQNLANKLADIVSQNYGTKMYERVENALIEGTDPQIKVIKKGENPELDIEGIPLIKKNEKELHDIFSDAIEDYVNANMNELGIDNHAGDQYRRVKEFFDEFGNFGEFLYKNRDLELNPKNIQENPEEDSLPGDKKIIEDTKQLTKYQLDKEANEREERAYQKYLKDHPKIKELLDATNNPSLDQITEKYFGNLKNAKEFNMIERKNSDGTVTMIPQRSTNRAQSVKTFIDSDNNQDYISLFLLGKNCSAKDMKEAIDGVKNNLKCYRNTQLKLNNAIRKGDSPEKIRKLNEAYQLYEKQFKTTFSHLVQLFAEKTKGTDNYDKFYKPVLTGDTSKNSIETDYSNAQLIINDMSKAIYDHGINKNRNLWISSDSKKIIKNSNKTINNKINELKALDAIIISDSTTQKEKYDAIQRFNIMCNSNGEVANLVGNIGDKILDPYIKNTKWNNNPNEHLRYSDIIRGSNKKNVDSYFKFLNLKERYEDIQKKFNNPAESKGKIESISNDLFGNKQVHTDLNALRNIKNNLDADHIYDVIDNINKLGNSINDDINKGRIHNTKINGENFRNIISNFTNINFDGKQLYDKNNINRQQYVDRINNLLQNNNKKNNFLIYMSNLANIVNLSKNHIEDETRKYYHEFDSFIGRSTKLNILQKFNDYLDRRKKSIDQNLKIYEGRLKNRGPLAQKELKEALKDQNQNTDLIDIIDGQFVDDYTDQNDRNRLIQLLSKFLNSTEKYLLPGKNQLALGNDSLLSKADNPEKDYYKLLFLNGLDYLRDCLPSWETIVEHFKSGYATAKHAVQVVKSIYRTVKVVLPLKSNIYPYMNQKFGFDIIGDKDYFDLAYKLTFNVKKMYSLKKYSVRHNMIYSEIFLPVSIFSKILFVNITTQNDYDNIMLYLINCANKGLEEFL